MSTIHFPLFRTFNLVRFSVFRVHENYADYNYHGHKSALNVPARMRLRERTSKQENERDR